MSVVLICAELVLRLPQGLVPSSRTRYPLKEPGTEFKVKFGVVAPDTVGLLPPLAKGTQVDPPLVENDHW